MCLFLQGPIDGYSCDINVTFHEKHLLKFEAKAGEYLFGQVKSKYTSGARDLLRWREEFVFKNSLNQENTYQKTGSMHR